MTLIKGSIKTYNTHCVKMSVFGVIMVHIFPAFSLICISPYSVQMRENAGKMRTRITPNTDTFYAVGVIWFY